MKLIGALALPLVMGVTTACQPTPQPTAATKVSNTVGIPCGGITTPMGTDWYFPVGTPKGMVWMQHGFTETKEDWDDFGRKAATDGFLAVAMTLPSANLFGCTVSNIGNNKPYLDEVTKVLADSTNTSSKFGKAYADAAKKAGRSGQALLTVGTITTLP